MQVLPERHPAHFGVGGLHDETRPTTDKINAAGRERTMNLRLDPEWTSRQSARSMAPIRSADLLSRLVTQATESLKKADANQSGTVTKVEDAGLPTALKQEVAEFRASHGSVRRTAFISKFEADARAELARVDANHDGMISDADQARLAAWLKDNVAAMGAVTPGPPPVTSQTAFGISGTIPSSRVELHTVLASGLDKPTAVAENPRDHSVWIVNEGDDSSTVIDPQGRAHHFQDDSAHFMNNPTAIAFSRTRNEFATVQDTTNDYNGHAMANMFMGPTVWTGDRTKFEGGTNSHLDMLHHSPEAMGIAAGEASANDPREYWVFNGHSGSIDRYFFHETHALGGTDHHDGETIRYAEGQLRRVAGVPGHMALDPASGKLFIADTGNGRVVSFDTRAASRQGVAISGLQDETPLSRGTAPALHTVTPAGALSKPAGLLLKDGMVIVGDHATGHIKVFTQGGELKGDLDTGLGANALNGLAEVNGKLYAADGKGSRLLEISVRV